MKRELNFLKATRLSPAFREKETEFKECYLTEEYIDEIPTSAGVYVIVAEDKTKFVYPNGRSSVIYIGKADNLQRRLREHLTQLNILIDNEKDLLADHIQPAPRYNYMKAFGAKIYLIPRKGRQDAKNLESEIIWRFYEKFRALPVGNGARSFGK